MLNVLCSLSVGSLGALTQWPSMTDPVSADITSCEHCLCVYITDAKAECISRLHYVCRFTGRLDAMAVNDGPWDLLT